VNDTLQTIVADRFMMMGRISSDETIYRPVWALPET
jgi:hypothetical protein